MDFEKYVLECDACECGEDRLRSEVGGAEIGGGEGQDFECEAFRFDHYEAGEGKAHHGEPIVESWVSVRRGDGWLFLVEFGGIHLSLSSLASNYALLRNGHRG